MSQPTSEPFNREESLNEPGIIGARWWQRSLASGSDPITRRSAMSSITVAVGAAMIGFAVLGAVTGASSSSSSDDEFRTETRTSLDMQKEYGWSFGAVGESLTFDGVSQKPFDRAALARMPDELKPASRALAAYFVPTLFQSPTALPRTLPQGDATTVTPLKDALRPISTPAMDRAYKAGRALASLWRGQSTSAAVVVDLPGPEAVAFAAGAAGVLDPVFLFDNWPHPRGVVKAHLTLAAAAYYQPLFAKKKAPSGAAPMFVLDRQRLSTYTDDAAQFDNRHVARVPPAAQMRSLGVSRVLYVAPTSADILEMDDLNDDFMLYKTSGIDVKIAAADAFSTDPSESTSVPPDEDGDASPRAYYGGRSATHLYFWIDYPWARSAPATAPTEPSFARPGASYSPRARVTPFSSGAPSIRAKPRPPGFGTVPVVIAAASGAILGAKLSRSGSWNRSPSWGSGG